MKTRRNIIKAAAGAITATAVGIPSVLHTKPQLVQPILQNILQTQTFPGPVGLSFLLRYKNMLPGPGLTLSIEKGTIETIDVRDFNEFDRKEFRRILQTVANKESHKIRSLITMSNMVAVRSRRGRANIFVCNPSDQKYVENLFKQTKVPGIIIISHPDVPRDYALAVYKGAEYWDGAGALCNMQGNEKGRIGIWTPDLDKFMYLGRFK
jgi:hypothetical protein